MSAHTAFTSTIIWTALSVVLVILVASFGRIFSGGTSSRINSKSPLKNTVVMGGIAGVVSAVPYMVAAILNNVRPEMSSEPINLRMNLSQPLIITTRGRSPLLHASAKDVVTSASHRLRP